MHQHSSICKRNRSKDIFLQWWSLSWTQFKMNSYCFMHDKHYPSFLLSSYLAALYSMSKSFLNCVIQHNKIVVSCLHSEMQYTHAGSKFISITSWKVFQPRLHAQWHSYTSVINGMEWKNQVNLQMSKCKNPCSFTSFIINFSALRSNVFRVNHQNINYLSRQNSS